MFIQFFTQSHNPAYNAALVESRVNDLYLPIYDYINTKTAEKRPLYIGISAPQGCGKTTLTNYLSLLFQRENKKCVVMSLDDYYLTGAEQEILAKQYSHNPLLQYRGNAGTHDVNLIMNTLEKLSMKDQKVLIPRYDKSLRNGRGDRAPMDKWEIVNSSNDVDIVLFEGWMLGFQAIESKIIDANMREINDLLKQYQPLHFLFDSWIVLALDDINTVYKWRLQAEIMMRNAGKPGLSDNEVKDFVDRFMPAYKQYLPTLYVTGPECESTKQIDVLKLIIDSNRTAKSMEIMKKRHSKL